MKKENIIRITNQIISKSAAVFDSGLLSGKMGLIMYLFHYSKYSDNKLYADFAELLIDDIFEDIHDKMSFTLDKGLSGIGWGIEYILKNNFVEGDSIEILEDIDKQIMKWDIRRIEDETLESGLEGLFHYILYHLPINNSYQCPFDEVYLNDLDDFSRNRNDKCKNKELENLLFLYGNWREGKNMEYFPDRLVKHLLSFEVNIDDDNIPVGLHKGYAGIGFQIMNTFNL